MADPAHPRPQSELDGPAVDPTFAATLDELVAVAAKGQRPSSEWFNPSDSWLFGHMRLFQDLASSEREGLLAEANEVTEKAERANAQGRAAERVWPRAALRLDNGGLAFFSQLGVARRPDITHYFIDGFEANRHASAFSGHHQALFADVFPFITRFMERHFEAGDHVIQLDRRIGDAPGRSFHARLLLLGIEYLQVPYMWRQLTFDVPENERSAAPQILEVSVPNWLEDLGLPAELKNRIEAAGVDKLVLKAPTKGLSLHLGFDYVGEHKMGPLSIAMFMVKRAGGVAVQAALSMARTRDLNGDLKNTALVTVGPSLHGKSTLTIMLDLAGSELSRLLNLEADPREGVYPMNDDIVMMQPLARAQRSAGTLYSIDGTENSFYAVPFGLSREDDPITFDVVRGTEDAPNSQETLENVPIDPATGVPDYLRNPVRNMRMILSRQRLLTRKGADGLLSEMTRGRLTESVHVPLEDTDRVFWQAAMRQNTVIPPLRRVTLDQYIRVLMYGEAVQMGAATGAIGKPYVEYFSDPFIIGLEDENANQLYRVLHEMATGGPEQHFYVFNTGGIGADRNEDASGPRYKKIPRELTLMLEEALLRGAVTFEYDNFLGSDLAVAIVDGVGREVFDLRQDWLPRNIYGEAEYAQRILELNRCRSYGSDSNYEAGILQYTKAHNEIMDLAHVPAPHNMRELAWLLSFYWNADVAYGTVEEFEAQLGEHPGPIPTVVAGLRGKCQEMAAYGVELTTRASALLRKLELL